MGRKKRFGYYESTTAEETAILLRAFYGFQNVGGDVMRGRAAMIVVKD